MGEAIQKKIAYVETLMTEALVLGLYGAADLAAIPSRDLAAAYNGCGPAWLADKAREKLTSYLGIFEPAFMIHDFRFERSDRTSTGFNAANTELEMNLRKIAKATYPWYNWRRYRALAAAEIITEACVRFGWTAWCGVAAHASTPPLTHSCIPLCLCASVLILLSGCYRSITVTRFDEYELEYRAVGLKTDVSKIEAEKTTNGTVRVTVEGVATDVSERNREIIESSGTAVGNVAQKVVEGMK